ncbi:hypothetical protein LQ953_13405 [Sphingomonas sp. IC-56]|uniref:hypothetical protein n=1 Tax=Sphingomonas sp. IC-56 TaxID=2898529 RepID=UPI001E5A4E8E|nr:hypothetical protein [Sphingomonas sp. IC-56]MCD2325015.1 hypothetical protein [Sphingomonas sp. IC-56]
MSALHIRFGADRSLPLDLLLGSIPSLPRHILSRLVDQAIERMDELDGDPDLEPGGDELDGTNAEDEPYTPWPSYTAVHGAGCPISDADGCSAADDGCGPILRGGGVIWGSVEDEPV